VHLVIIWLVLYVHIVQQILVNVYVVILWVVYVRYVIMVMLYRRVIRVANLVRIRLRIVSIVHQYRIVRLVNRCIIRMVVFVQVVLLVA
jgi:hypothetical protein